MNEVMRIIKDLEVTVIEQNFELECIMRLAVRKSFYMPVTEKLKAIEYLTLYENWIITRFEQAYQLHR